MGIYGWMGAKVTQVVALGMVGEVYCIFKRLIGVYGDGVEGDIFG